MITKVILPPITFHGQKFKTKKEAKQAAIKAFMNSINDKGILSTIKIKKLKRTRCNHETN